MASQEDEELRMPKSSATGTRTRVARERAEYLNQLDYSGPCLNSHMQSSLVCNYGAGAT